jgi:low affinity Fe/Cu permease/predicted GNAT family N-acyltransferase
MGNKKKGFSLFEQFANAATKFTGSSTRILKCCKYNSAVGCLRTDLFGYSETWQLVINTGTTIITFLMVFLIQKAQNKDSKAIQLKLNELIAAQEYTSNRMVDIEDLSEEELDQLHKYYVKLAMLAKKENDIHCSHSIDAAEDNSIKKSKTSGNPKKQIMETLQVQKVTNNDDLEKVFAIRKIVFVGEQNCPPELEWENEDVSTHFLALSDSNPCGASRWRKTDNGYKLERFAVLKQFRGRGVGKALVTAVLNDLPADADYIYLNAQLDAMRLYAKFGFVAEGDQFEEAGIQHFKMVKRS